MPRQKPHVFQHHINGVLVRLYYLLYLPEGYGANDALWPAVLFLHGAGERGNDLELVKKHGPPKLVAEGREFPFLLMSPQCPLGHFWPVPLLVGLVNEVTTAYRVDADRFYLTGISMGGYATWQVACTEPERFAAAVPICGGGEPVQACRMKDVPVWAFHGAKDDVVPLSEAKEMVEALRACGGDVRLTVYPDAGHDSWTRTYENPEVFDWLLSHRRAGKASARHQPIRSPAG